MFNSFLAGLVRCRLYVAVSKQPSHTAHSKVLLLRAYLKVTFHETMAFSFILGSNRPNQMPRGISENFCTPRGARGRGGGA